MSNTKPEQETIIPPYPLAGTPPPTKPAQVETAEEAGAGKSDKQQMDDDEEPGPAAEQRPPSDS